MEYAVIVAERQDGGVDIVYSEGIYGLLAFAIEKRNDYKRVSIEDLRKLPTDRTNRDTWTYDYIKEYISNYKPKKRWWECLF